MPSAKNGGNLTTAADIYRAHPSRAAIDELLARRLTAAVATINPDGSIHQAYVLFLFENQKLYWETASSTRKAKNLVANSRTSFLVDGKTTGGTNLMVAGSGSAQILTGSTAEAINRRLRAK